MLMLIVNVIFIVLLVQGSAHKNLENLERVVRLLPKLELHAHLHGSIRLSTLQELSIAAGNGPIEVTVSNEHSGQVEKPFELFPIIHRTVTSKEVVLRILQEMIEDYQNENTIYMEIRSTPRSLPDGTTAAEYVELLVNAIARHNHQNGDKILVKLIVSIDRSRSYTDALQTLQYLRDYSTVRAENAETSERVIVGVDFSGNPLGGRFQEFSPIFLEARKMGFNITAHTAEARELTEAGENDETNAILDFRPDRVGHMLYLREKHLKKLFSLRQEGHAIQVEICPSTSFFVLHLPSFADHPYIRKFLSMGHPFSINTDDSAIFNTTLTREILHMAHALSWSSGEVLQLQARSLKHIFASTSERGQVAAHFWSMVTALQEEDQREQNGSGTGGVSNGLEGITEESVAESDGHGFVKSDIDMSSLYTM